MPVLESKMVAICVEIVIHLGTLPRVDDLYFDHQKLP